MQIDHTPPYVMTIDERLDEISGILREGLLRLKRRKADDPFKESIIFKDFLNTTQTECGRGQ